MDFADKFPLWCGFLTQASILFGRSRDQDGIYIRDFYAIKQADQSLTAIQCLSLVAGGDVLSPRWLDAIRDGLTNHSWIL